ncbi:uncharacterized protein [Drosophila kikkawai]|uniref:Uncharacterized protein n=1 Tax=Drosophila kikkawai TaxID=30033 RepID=A0A6P4IWE1_DROKI|nr:uncharacterized protein LOC108078120 [Drosophila kikkawai]
MLFAASLICQVERLMCLPISFAVLGFLFMACTMEVVLLKMTTSDPVFGRSGPPDDWEEGGGPEGDEEQIYYENLENNFEHWARRRMRFHQRQQQRLQQQQQQQLVT